MTGIEKAVAQAGSSAALARALGESRQRINYWREIEGVPKLASALLIEKIYGIPVAELVPSKERAA